MPYMVDDSVDGRMVYTVGATGIDTFAVPFPVASRDDLVVLVGGVVRNDWTWEVSNSTDIGIATSSLIRFANPIANATVVIERRGRLRQAWSIVTTSAWRPREHSREIARLWLALQDIVRRINRAIRVSLNASPTDPLVGTNRIVTLDSEGRPKAATPQEAGEMLSAVLLPRSGGAMTGQITMPVPPTQATHVATKGYVDAAVGSSGGGGSGPYLALSGGTLTGKLTIQYGAPEFEIAQSGANAGNAVAMRVTTDGGTPIFGVDVARASSGARLVDFFGALEGQAEVRIRSADAASSKVTVHRLGNVVGGSSALALPASHRIGIGTDNPAVKVHIADTGAIVVPAGTNAQRPNPVPGGLRVNTTTGKLEYVATDTWIEAGAGSGLSDVIDQPQLTVVDVASGATIPVTAAFERLVVQANKVREARTIVRVAGTGDATVTLPDQADGVVAGTVFVVRNERSNGQLVIQRKNADSTINGGASVLCPWTNGVVVCRCEGVNTGNNGVTWVATGFLSTPLDLPAIRVRGDAVFEGTTQAGRRAVGADISGNYTVQSSDIGRLRIVTGSNVTVTWPSDLRGSAEFHFVNAGTFAFAGGSSWSIAANTRVFAESVQSGSTVYRWMFRSTVG